MLKMIPAREILAIQDAMGGAVAEMLSATEAIQQVMGPILRINEIAAAIRIPDVSLPKIEPIALSAPGDAVLRLQTSVSELSQIRAKVIDHEERLLAVEKVVRELRDLVKDPELPEELKEKVKELLESIQDLDYIR